MDDHPESESDVADEVENMEQQTESPSPGPSPSKVLLSGPEQCDACRRAGATCTPIAGNVTGCQNRRFNAMACSLEKIREVANSADYDPSPTPSHGPGPSPLEATHTPPRSVPEPQRIPTVTLWDPKTGKQIYTPPKTSPVGRRMGTTLSKPPKAPTTPAFLGPTIGTFYPSRKGPTPSKAPTTPAFPGPLLGTFYPSGKPPIRVLHPNNASKVGHTQKGNEPEVDSQETNQEHREDSQETDDIEGLIKDIQQPLEGIMLNALEPDSQVSRDQAMAGSVHAAQMVALLNASPDKLKGMSFGQLVEPARARHTKEELAAAGNLGRRDLIDEGARK